MELRFKNFSPTISFFLPVFLLLMFLPSAHSQDPFASFNALDKSAMETGEPVVELNGDIVEYSADQTKATAKGNVVINYRGVTMTCDKLDFYQKTKVAEAEGNVARAAEEMGVDRSHLYRRMRNLGIKQQ